MSKANIKDLKLELWLRMRNGGEIKWTTKDGQEIPIKDMSTEHLLNAINRLTIRNEMVDENLETYWI